LSGLGEKKLLTKFTNPSAHLFSLICQTHSSCLTEYMYTMFGWRELKKRELVKRGIEEKYQTSLVWIGKSL